jgi:hypothetical protein
MVVDVLASVWDFLTSHINRCVLNLQVVFLNIGYFFGTTPGTGVVPRVLEWGEFWTKQPIRFVVPVGILVIRGSCWFMLYLNPQTFATVSIVYYESIKQKLNQRLILDCWCDTRLKVKVEGSTRLTYTGWCGELEHLKT